MAQLLLPIVAGMLPVVLNQSLVTIFIQIIFSTLLILLTAQFPSKVLGNIYPNKMLLVDRNSVLAFHFLFYFHLPT